MDKINIYALIRLGSFVLNILLILILYRGCNCDKCPQIANQTVVVEKVYGDTGTSKIVVEMVAPKPKKVKQSLLRKNLVNENGFSIKYKIDTLPCDTVRVMAHELITLLPDTCFYSDTLRAYNDYKIVYDVTVEGKLLDFKLWHANLKPEISTTITNMVIKKPKPQVYMGAIVGVNNKGTNFVFGPAAAVTYHSFMGNYSYDIRSGSHQLGGYWRVFGK